VDRKYFLVYVDLFSFKCIFDINDKSSGISAADQSVLENDDSALNENSHKKRADRDVDIEPRKKWL
jgi:hypothetical protein